MKPIAEILASYKKAKAAGTAPPASSFIKGFVIQKPLYADVDKTIPCFSIVGDVLINERMLDSSWGRHSPMSIAKNYCIDQAMKGSTEALKYLAKLLVMSGTGYETSIKACLTQVAIDAPDEVSALFAECYPTKPNPYSKKTGIEEKAEGKQEITIQIGMS